MAIISKEEQEKIKKFFQEKMKDKVNILYFADENDCQYCNETRELLTELSELSDLINLETYMIDDEKAEEYGIDRTPATIFIDEEGHDLNVHFYGIPSGYEFNTLLEDIVDISTKSPDLPDEVIDEIKAIDEDVLLQVFVTPTCPYCPPAVMLAHRLAYYSDKVTADMVEVQEFPHLANKYGVQGVPRSVVNEKWFMEGAAPEAMLIAKIKESL